MKNLTMNVYELAEQGYVSEKWREISGLGTLSSEMCLWAIPHRSVPYVPLEHAYHHLNFAWNTRTMEPEQADAQFVRHEKFPRAFDRFWPLRRKSAK